jgi:hypothetical protein
MATPQDITLKVGEEAKLRGGLGGGWSITYAGMPNRDTYSVAIRWTSGNAGAAHNLFLSTGQTEFASAKGQIRVYSVSSHEIRLRFSK